MFTLRFSIFIRVAHVLGVLDDANPVIFTSVIAHVAGT